MKRLVKVIAKYTLVVILIILFGITMLNVKVPSSAKYMHFSIDDVYASLYDLQTHNYNSIFENSFLNRLKYYHDKYGIKITLNCFNESLSRPDYDIAQVFERYGREFLANSDWLKFSFHAKNEKTNYKQLNVEDLCNDYSYFYNSLFQATKSESVIDPFMRLGFFGISEKQALALNLEFNILGIYAPDDNRETEDFLQIPDQKLGYKNKRNHLYVLRTQKRLENVSESEVLSEFEKFESQLSISNAGGGVFNNRNFYS